ncbi:MAG: hypothetical protein JNM43_16240 [Planctomycetaceae bacterium]|nr:hypothetical protein [Planctomycetaceae bacterium]
MGAFVCVLPFVLIIILVIGAVLLRIAVQITNQVVGNKPSSSNTQFGYQSESYGTSRGMLDESNPFAVPQVQTIAADVSLGTGVPTPDFGRACLIVFVNGLANFAVGVVLGLVMGGGEARILSQLLGIGVSIFVYQNMLPTTLGRAALVWLFQFLIVVAIVIVIVVILLMTGVALR